MYVSATRHSESLRATQDAAPRHFYAVPISKFLTSIKYNLYAPFNMGRFRLDRVCTRGAQWPRGRCAWRSRKLSDVHKRSVIGWLTKIYYLELILASEGTLSCPSRLHLQSLAPTPVSRRVDVRQVAGLKNNCRIFITT
jgi:hypothetical protein